MPRCVSYIASRNLTLIIWPVGGYDDTPELRRTLRIMGTPPPTILYTGNMVTLS